MFVTNRATVTRVLVIVNVVVHAFLTGAMLADPQNMLWVREVYFKFGLVPDRFWYDQAVWQPLTSMFMHSHMLRMTAGGLPIVSSGELIFHLLTTGLLHLAVNMIVLMSVGGIVERTIGHGKFAWLYFISGGVSAVFVLIFSGSSMPTVGASGAIFGVMGSLAILHPRARMLLLFIPMSALTAVIVMGVLSILGMWADFPPGLSHSGHLGGMVGGLLYVWLAVRLGEFAEARAALGESALARDERGKVEREIMNHIRDRSGDTLDSPGADAMPYPETPARPDFTPGPETPPGLKPAPGRKLYFDANTGRFYYK